MRVLLTRWEKEVAEDALNDLIESGKSQSKPASDILGKMTMATRVVLEYGDEPDVRWPTYTTGTTSES